LIFFRSQILQVLFLPLLSNSSALPSGQSWLFHLSHA
jgi:hypothetical protein